MDTCLQVQFSVVLHTEVVAPVVVVSSACTHGTFTFERANVKVIFANFDTKGCESDLHLISSKKIVLILIFCLLQSLSTNSASFFQYLLMFRETKVRHLNVLIEPSSTLNLD